MSAYPADRVAVYVAAPLLRWAVDGEAHARTLEAFAMTLPPWLARANRRVTNRLWGPLAPHLPGFGVIVHAGRKSHRRYRTPVNVFPRADGYVIALTYVPDADWVRNVLADGGCTLETRGRTLRLSRPRLFHDERRRSMPAPVRLILTLADVSDFLELKQDGGMADEAGPSSEW